MQRGRGLEEGGREGRDGAGGRERTEPSAARAEVRGDSKCIYLVGISERNIRARNSFLRIRKYNSGKIHIRRGNNRRV